MRGKKRVVVAVLLASMLVVMSGCQLAKANLGVDSLAESRGDRICGVMVFDSKESPYHIAKQQLEGKETLISTGGNMGSALGDPIYIEGTLDEERNYRFGELDGPALFGFAGTVEESEEDFWREKHLNRTQGEMQEFCMALKDQEKERIFSEEGTVLLKAQTDKIVNFWMAPIYERPDGSVYLVLDPSIGGSSAQLTEGCALTKDIEESYEVMSEGRKITLSIGFKVTARGEKECLKSTVKEMNAHDQLIRSTEITLTKDEKFKISEETAYIIVEDTLIESDETTKVKRSVYDIEKQLLSNEQISHITHYAGKSAFLETRAITFER